MRARRRPGDAWPAPSDGASSKEKLRWNRIYRSELASLLLIVVVPACAVLYLLPLLLPRPSALPASGPNCRVFTGRAELACREWSHSCKAPWVDALALAAQGTVACYGESPEAGQFCIAPSVCVSEAHGAWVPSERLSAESAAAVGSHLPGLVMLGLGTDMDSERFKLPVRATAEVLGLTDPAQLTDSAVLVRSAAPAVMMSFYECSHLSHFLYNGLFPVFASWLRMGARHDTVLIVERANRCSFVELLGAMFNLGAGRGSSSSSSLIGGRGIAVDGSVDDTALMRLDRPKSLPATPHCFGPTLIGSRGSCLHNYCPRAMTEMEAAMIRGVTLSHFGINSEPALPPRALRAPHIHMDDLAAHLPPIRVTVVQRLTSRVITNLPEVVAMLEDMQRRGSAYCDANGGSEGNGISSDDALHIALRDSPDLVSRFCGSVARSPSHAPFEFVVEEFEDRSVESQMSAFAHTDVLIAVHGNALGHVMWMQPGAAVIEIFMKDWWSPWFAEPIRWFMNLHYEDVRCPIRSCMPGTDELVDDVVHREALRKSDPNRFDGIIKVRNVSVLIDDLAPAVIRSMVASAESTTVEHQRLLDSSRRGWGWTSLRNPFAAAAARLTKKPMRCGLEKTAEWRK